jgi:hypothetical protein
MANEEGNGSGLFDRGIQIDGGVVRRPRGFWTESVHALLVWLDSTGYALAPRPIGVDSDSEYVSYVPGRGQGWPLLDFIQSEAGARAAGTFVADLQRHLEAYGPPDGARWQSVLAGSNLSGRVSIQHGDLGPWNLLWDPDAGRVCAVIDWDLAGPAPAGFDVGFLAWFMVPMMSDGRALERGYKLPIDRRARLRSYCEGCERPESDVLAQIGAAQDAFRERIAAAGPEDGSIWSRLNAAGLGEQIQGDRSFLLRWSDL